jgi:hypothetical protein
MRGVFQLFPYKMTKKDPKQQPILAVSGSGYLRAAGKAAGGRHLFAARLYTKLETISRVKAEVP